MMQQANYRQLKIWLAKWDYADIAAGLIKVDISIHIIGSMYCYMHNVMSTMHAREEGP